MSLLLKPEKLTLSSVKKDYSRWRASGRPGVKVPDNLREKAVMLLEEYSISKILKELGLSSNMLLEWRRGFHENIFFKVPAEAKTSTGNFSLKISRDRNGECWSIESELSLEQWKSVINLLD